MSASVYEKYNEMYNDQLVTQKDAFSGLTANAIKWLYRMIFPISYIF